MRAEGVCRGMSKSLELSGSAEVHCIWFVTNACCCQPPSRSNTSDLSYPARVDVYHASRARLAALKRKLPRGQIKTNQKGEQSAAARLLWSFDSLLC